MSFDALQRQNGTLSDAGLLDWTVLLPRQRIIKR